MQYFLHIIKYNIVKKYLPLETRKHGEKIEWYYKKIKAKDYENLWYNSKLE